MRNSICMLSFPISHIVFLQKMYVVLIGLGVCFFAKCVPVLVKDFKDYQCLLSRLSKSSLHFKDYQSLLSRLSKSSLHFKDYQCLLSRLSKSSLLFKHYQSFVKTIKVFFTFQRLLESFVKTIKVFFTFQRLSKSIVLQRLSMSSALYFSKTIRVFCQDFNVFFTFQRLQYPLLRLQHLFYILRLQYLLLLSDPNFVQGLSFANVLILASRIKLFDTSCRARRKIIQHFGKECVKYPKGRSKGSF